METNLTITIATAEADALAQFLKRVQYSDIERRAVNEGEANLMQNALSEIRKALAEKGHDPR